jgi:hypothetical protein
MNFLDPDFRLRTSDNINDLGISATAVCLYSEYDVDDRASLEFWRARTRAFPENHVAIEYESDQEVGLRRGYGSEQRLDLRDRRSLAALLSSRHIVIDISGMSNHVWPMMVKTAMEEQQSVQVVYTEPQSYRFHTTPADLFSFDLSERVKGVAPIPGFANLRTVSDQVKSIFVPLLGFEGDRPRQVILELDPAPPKIIPIVGVPGFQLEYPTFAVTCNKEFLDEQRAHGYMRVAPADDPFGTLRVLREIQKDNPNHHIYIAPLGTKPHCLGAILFALRWPRSVEVLYDHPLRKQGGRQGRGNSHIYTVVCEAL